MKKLIPNTVPTTILVACLLGAAGAAKAAPIIDFSPSHSGSSVSGGAQGITLSLANESHFGDFSLADGESHTFNFFNVDYWHGGSSNSTPVEATLAFNSPAVSADASGVASRETSWVWRWGWHNIFEGGSLSWDQQPELIELDDGRSFSIALSEFDFDANGDWTTKNQKVTATITAYAAPAQVPLPGTLGLFALGLTGLALSHRRRAAG